ncbi:hypothetical protein [Saccharopolyspora phatthalungensis]|uniref:Uncharacterized protein n=1 Tax=Saccharopolyspora phatthalungensis TaxID=664693 RepID=A0A840PSC2_9PSEU|nr:hypothetical protein [Saccharopolyspora phatthalungensis]MBB5153182.1 hypothetical protein [Saccharopolyspora phatthalungensis]
MKHNRNSTSGEIVIQSAENNGTGSDVSSPAAINLNFGGAKKHVEVRGDIHGDLTFGS